jgi:hypothetical protein
LKNYAQVAVQCGAGEEIVDGNSGMVGVDSTELHGVDDRCVDGIDWVEAEKVAKRSPRQAMESMIEECRREDAEDGRGH